MVLAPPIGQQPGVDPAGCSVLTRPSSISGEPVTAATSVTGRPGVAERAAVPPVETSSKPQRDQPPAEVDQARLVRDRQERSTRERDDAPRPVPCPPGRRRPSTSTAPDGDERDRPWQEPVLDGMDPRREAGLVVAGEHRDGLLEEDRSAVERLVDEVDRDAGHAHAVGQGVGHGMGAGERRQERRMRR